MEIVQERLEREYDVNLIVTAPTVEYKVTKLPMEVKLKSKHQTNSQILLRYAEIREPWVRTEILTPTNTSEN
jgi:GTP-binding protein LepA